MADKDNVMGHEATTRPLHECISLALDSVEMNKENIEHNVPYIVGPPGGGKSAMIKEYAQRRDYNYLGYEPALERVEKFGGIPEIVPTKVTYGGKTDDELHTKWSVPQMICEIREMSQNGKPTVVLLDDWHLGDQEIQKIGFEMFTHRSLNGHKIPKNASFILAGNQSSAAGARVQMSAIRNRSTMLYSFSDPEFWINNYAIPKRINTTGIAFFSKTENKGWFHMDESATTQFGSPRSWVSAFNMISNLEKKGLKLKSSDFKFKFNAIVEGNVGKEAASAFAHYYFIQREIDTKQIFDTGKWTLPEKEINIYAYAYAVASEFQDRLISTNKTKDVVTVDDIKKNKDSLSVCSIFADIIKKVNEVKPEIGMKVFSYIVDIPKNKDFGVGFDGNDIMFLLLEKRYLEAGILTKLSNACRQIHQL